MLITIEGILLIAGVWAIIRGRIPSLVIGGTEYTAEGSGARSIGLLLVLPLPLSLLSMAILVRVFGKDAAGFSIPVEISILVLVAIATFVAVRLIGKPRALEAIELERVISRKANGSLIYAITGLLGFVGIVLGPLAFCRAGLAIELIEAHGIGQEHQKNAKLARTIAIVAITIWVLALLGFLLFALPGFSMGAGLI